MGVLQFDGVNDQLKWTSVTQALADVTDGAWTIGSLFKISDDTHFNQFLNLHSGAAGGTNEAGFSWNPGQASFDVEVDAGSIFPSNPSVTNAVIMMVVSKGAGSVAPRCGFKIGAAGSWTHEDGDAAIADQIDCAQVQIGTWQDTDFMEGWIGLCAAWEGAMSDGNKEALDDNWRTSDWWNSAHGQPKFLAELNVAGASVVDLAGNASSLTATGTTLDSGETLDSWNFNGVGTEPAGEAGPRLIVTQANRQVW